MVWRPPAQAEVIGSTAKPLHSHTWKFDEARIHGQGPWEITIMAKYMPHSDLIMFAPAATSVTMHDTKSVV